MAAASLELILAWGPARIAATLSAFNRELAARLRSIGLAILPEALRGPHFLSVRLPPGAPADLVERLAREGVHVSRRGEHLRITPHLYNAPADADRLVEALPRWAPGEPG